MTQPSTPSSSRLPENTLNVFAQRLNNSAALCIEVGQFDRAIVSLQRALELSKKIMTSTNDITTTDHQPCQAITLDGCIAFSEANSLYSNITKSSSKSDATTNTCGLTDIVHSMVDTSSARSATNDRNDTTSRCNKRRRIQISASEPSITVSPMDLVHYNSGHNDYYVCTRPIRVPRRDQQMGSVLFLAILFNLALAHHLKATSMRSMRRTNPPQFMNRAKSVQKALMLYQLILDYWSKLRLREGKNSNDFSSIRFRMILNNNLGQIYNWTDNPMKEEECLQDLLSSVMIVTAQVNQHSTSTFGGVGFKRDLEGFLTNTEALTAVERCAQAA